MSWKQRHAFREAILSKLDLDGRGLEVAPYFNPLTDKTSLNVAYTDYISTEEIQKKASSNPGGELSTDIPAIDFVWAPGKHLRDCIPKAEVFDYAVASHVLEHVPNPTGWLLEILSVMRTGATLAVVLPNKTATTDYFRAETTDAQLVGWWADQPSIPTAGQIFDFLGTSVERTDGIPLVFPAQISSDALRRSYDDSTTMQFISMAVSQHYYLDIHCSVWTPERFVDAMTRLTEVGLLNVTVGAAIEEPVDFAVHLTKLGEPRIAPPRRQALAASTATSFAKRTVRSILRRVGMTS